MRERRVRLQRLSTVSYSAIGTSASHGRLKSAVVLRSTACFRMIDIRSAHPVSTSPSVGIISSGRRRSEEHTSELQSRLHLVCRLLLDKKKHTETYELLHCALAARPRH